MSARNDADPLPVMDGPLNGSFVACAGEYFVSDLGMEIPLTPSEGEAPSRAHFTTVTYRLIYLGRRRGYAWSCM